MKVYVHKLGCPKNDVDADYIWARLIAAGHEPVSDPEEAESIIVNTCGFILPAKEESVNELIRLGQLKKNGKLKTLYASGCLTQKYGDEMLSEMDELDGAFGLGALDSLAEAVSSSKKLDKVVRRETRKLGYLTWKDRYISDGFPWAYLKISDGCDRGCSYCTIPSMRGHFRSRPIDSIMREAQFLADNGKKELILVSQEATLYGQGMKDRSSVVDLLKALEKIDGVEWIRLMYLHPTGLTDSLIEYLGSENKSLPYFDLPLQHINTDILESMKRQTTREQIEARVKSIRSRCPESIIRTTFIVGFPGETDEQFEELFDFVEEQRFDRLGVFPFSAEEGTPAAELPDQIDEETKAERMDRIMTTQRDIAFEKNNALIDSLLEVIIDTVNSNSNGSPAVGRTVGDCPEIDQEIYVEGSALKSGDLCQVRVTATDGYDLQGRLEQARSA